VLGSPVWGHGGGGRGTEEEELVWSFFFFGERETGRRRRGLDGPTLSVRPGPSDWASWSQSRCYGPGLSPRWVVAAGSQPFFSIHPTVILHETRDQCPFIVGINWPMPVRFSVNLVINLAYLIVGINWLMKVRFVGNLVINISYFS
jgi:hypothetical protein